jgi:hypothetical protein
MAEDGAFEQAERLVREAQQAAEHAARAAAANVPPRGWSSGGPPGGPAFPDLTALGTLLDSVRGTLPPELARQLADAVRDLLVALRAVLDFSIARLEQAAGPDQPVAVEDIPVD